MMKDKKKTIYAVVLLITMILLASIGTYAFFSSGVDNSKNQRATLETGTMKLTFTDNDSGINEKLNPNEKVTKKFKIINTGSLEASLSINWEKLVNTYTNGSLTYDLKFCEEENGTYKNIITNTNVPVSDTPISQKIESELSVPAGDTYYYELIITLNDLKGVNQTDDYDAYLNTRFSASEPTRYKYYTLSVNPNGGKWNGFTATQIYNLKNNETFDIPNPVKTGSTFKGWRLEGLSSTIDGTTFTMGIGNTVLTAEWEEEKYDVSINLEDGIYDGTLPTELSYMESFELDTPTKEGYTFTHWSSDDGLIEGNTFTLTSNKSPIIKANWSVNKYKYIVYHNKQNVNDDEYTVSSTDTVEGEAEYNTIVSPDVKTFTGFRSPEKKTHTIKHEVATTPVLNKIDYDYTRNKHTLTIDTKDGEYTGATTNELKYEQTVALDIPTKTGYTFSNWTASSGSMDANTFKMGDEDATVTANYTPNKYTITFNANGGSVTTESMEVTYDTEYGTLPTPTYGEYVFLGWFTDATEGDKITEDMLCNLNGNIILYAHWKENTPNFMMKNGLSKLKSQSSKIKQIIFENSINPVSNATSSYDASEEGNGSIMVYIAPTTEDTSMYSAHIQANGKIMANQDCSDLFYGFEKLESIDGLENFDTSNVTDMGAMFSYCNSLTTLDLSSFDTSNVTNMGLMFYEDGGIISINLSSFDTSKVTNMFSMFEGCVSLATLDVSSFDTSNVTNMRQMFSGCSSLTTLDLSSFDTSNITEMNYMFAFCRNLTTLDLSSFDTSNVTSMYHMFEGASKIITTITIRGIKCENWSSMFENAATETGSKITVNYTEDASVLVTQMINGKSAKSRVVKGTVVS